MLAMFSPCMGGWSVGSFWESRPRPVLPLHGGMVRGGGRALKSSSSSPPAWGDGPVGDERPDHRAQFSPCMGGWSEPVAMSDVILIVLPLHGRMVRRRKRAHHERRGSPPAWGDGPMTESDALDHLRFSPCMGGWSEWLLGTGETREVLPLHGGMVRSPTTSSRQAGCSPPAWGDGPFPAKATGIKRGFSPCMGGWSADPATLQSRRIVLPLHGGMVRTTTMTSQIILSSPPAWGDGPGPRIHAGRVVQFSPCMGGWSVLRSPPVDWVIGSPPASGDGPPDGMIVGGA